MTIPLAASIHAQISSWNSPASSADPPLPRTAGHARRPGAPALVLGIEIPFPHLSLYFGEASRPLAIANEEHLAPSRPQKRA